MELEVGTVVRSKAGRDSGLLFAVVEVAKDCVYLCDGKLRPLERPKRKNMRHIVVTQTQLPSELMATNRRLKKALRAIESGAGTVI